MANNEYKHIQIMSETSTQAKG